MQYVIRWAEAEGFLRVTLLADGANERALGFYRRMAFQDSSMVVRRLVLCGAARQKND